MNGSAAPLGTLSLTSLGIGYEVLARQRFGPAEIAWTRVTPTDESVIGAGALSSLSIAETGVVAFVCVTNRYARPVLLTADLVLRGGYQTRVVERSVIVLPGEIVDVPVRCVEQGRWRPENARPWALSVAEPARTDTRTEFLRNKQAKLRRTSTYGLDQRQVWSRVDTELTRSGVASPSRSYGALLDAPRDVARAATDRLVYDAPAGANALAICVAGETAWFEAFASHVELVSQAPAVLASLSDVFRDRRATRRPSAREQAASCTKTLLAWVWSARLQSVEGVAGTPGAPFAIASPGLSGELLLLGDAAVHIAVAATG